MSARPEWMKKFEQIGQKGQEEVTTVGDEGKIEKRGESTSNVYNPKVVGLKTAGNTTTPPWMVKKNPPAATTTTTSTTDQKEEDEDAAALFHGAASALAYSVPPLQSKPFVEEVDDDAAALFFHAAETPAIVQEPPESTTFPITTDEDMVTVEDSTTSGDNRSSWAPPEPEAPLALYTTTRSNTNQMNDNDQAAAAGGVEEEKEDVAPRSEFAAAAYAAANEEIGESWVVDKEQIMESEEVMEEEHDAPRSTSSFEEYYLDDYGNEVLIEKTEEEEVVRDREMNEEVLQDEEQNIQSRSAQIAPEPQEVFPKYDIEDQRRVIESTARGKRSYMSPFVPIMAFLIIVSAILLIVFFVVLPDDETSRSVPSMAPSRLFLPLEPTNNGNIAAAATTPLDPFQNSCDFDLLTQPNVIDQCACSSSISILADDVRARWEDLANNFMQTVFPGWNEDISSCSAENQALVWMSTGINNGGEIDNTLKLQRYSLALLYIYQLGTDWIRSENWMTEQDACVWEGVTCNSDSYVQILMLDRNRLSGPVSCERLLR
jgi:hypothetical protein